jgi:hypothetical protein
VNYAKPGIGGQLLGDCHRPSLPNKFGTNPQAESGKRLTAAALRDDDLRTPTLRHNWGKKKLTGSSIRHSVPFSIFEISVLGVIF